MYVRTCMISLSRQWTIQNQIAWRHCKFATTTSTAPWAWVPKAGKPPLQRTNDGSNWWCSQVVRQSLQSPITKFRFAVVLSRLYWDYIFHFFLFFFFWFSIIVSTWFLHRPTRVDIPSTAVTNNLLTIQVSVWHLTIQNLHRALTTWIDFSSIK